MGLVYGPDRAAWPILMEKAMAKLRGNYSHLDGGQSYRGIRFLRGGPWDRFTINDSDNNTGMATNDVWDIIT